MSESLSAEEVAILIRARQILKEKGLSADADITEVCKAAGVSRKTGYQWVEKHLGGDKDRQKEFEAKLKQLELENEKLKKDNDWLDFVNQGRELAWKIHRVDEYLAAKKNSSLSQKKKKP